MILFLGIVGQARQFKVLLWEHCKIDRGDCDEILLQKTRTRVFLEFQFFEEIFEFKFLYISSWYLEFSFWNFSNQKYRQKKHRTMRPLKISVEGNIATGNKLNRLKFTHWLPLAVDRTKKWLHIASRTPYPGPVRGTLVWTWGKVNRHL